MMGEAGLKSEKEAADFFDVSLRSIKNWRKSDKPPRAVFLCLELMTGKLDCIGKKWNGYRLRHDVIESPEGNFIYAHEVKAISYLYQMAKLNRTKLCMEMERRENRLNDNSALSVNEITNLISKKKASL